ncbi:MAG: ATP-dependent DNA helicase, partial [Desulfobulbus sp.]|nr:ATP-dependent DNA helicase [Desulfobulbus sp.]
TEQSEEIEKWIKTTVHADRSELTWLSADSPLWQKICCQTQFCLGQDCPDGAACFLHRLRRDAAASNLLIVNHHLLFSDLALRKSGYGEVLPRYETVIFDEAHHLETVATTYFGFTFSRHQVLDLCSDVERSAQTDLSTEHREQIIGAANRLRAAVEKFANTFPALKGRYLLPALLDGHPEIHRCRDDLGSALSQLAAKMEAIGTSDGPWSQYAHRAGELEERLTVITVEQFEDIRPEDIRHTYWYERTERNLSLFATPVDVAPELDLTLFTQVRHCVFTSATLTAGDGFLYFLNRLGLPADTRTLQLPSPFDYPGRTLLYIPGSNYPEPGTPGHPHAQQEEMTALIGYAGGRTLALFTSIAAMNQAYEKLFDILPYPLLRQGDASRRILLERFRKTTNSVLFAVASFWEGIDVPGESLSLVIIDKLPFEVPTDPVIMARIQRIKALGGNPFKDYQVPGAILSLRQGVGRLMRTAKDRGVIAILDTRLFTRGYGRQFLRSLPPSPITREQTDVAAFFRNSNRRATDAQTSL